MQTISEIKLHSVVNNVVSEGWLSLPLPSTSHLRQAPRMYSFIAITQAVHGFFSLLTRPSGWTLLKFFHANQFCHIFSVLVCIHLLKFSSIYMRNSSVTSEHKEMKSLSP